MCAAHQFADAKKGLVELKLTRGNTIYGGKRDASIDLIADKARSIQLNGKWRHNSLEVRFLHFGVKSQQLHLLLQQKDILRFMYLRKVPTLNFDALDAFNNAKHIREDGLVKSNVNKS